MGRRTAQGATGISAQQPGCVVRQPVTAVCARFVLADERSVWTLADGHSDLDLLREGMWFFGSL